MDSNWWKSSGRIKREWLLKAFLCLYRSRMFEGGQRQMNNKNIKPSKFKKLITGFLTLWLLLYSLLPISLFRSDIFAQEDTVPQSNNEQVVSATDAPTVTSSPEPLQTQEALATVSPSPSPTAPPYWSEDYDKWKIEKDKQDEIASLEDDARENREEEWNKNKDDNGWVASHGGSKEYYVSGQWQKDQEVLDLKNNDQKTSDTNETAVVIDEVLTENNNGIDDSSCLQNNQLLSSEDQSVTALNNSVDSNNCLILQNDIAASGTSGSNNQIKNDGDVTMQTGNSSASGQQINNGNTNVIDSESLETGALSSEESFTNNTHADENLSIGVESDGFTKTADTTTTLVVDNSNTAYVDNQMKVEAVSGSNILTDNDGNVTLTTGDLELVANMLNILNLNITGDDFMHLIVNIFGTLNGTIDLEDIASALNITNSDLEIIAKGDSNGSTQDDNNVDTTNSQTSTQINNTNNAVVNNQIEVTGISGENTVEGNDGTADIVTGRIKVLANLMNFINTNFSGEKWSFLMINIFGSLAGDIIVPGTENYLSSGMGGADLPEGLVSNNDDNSSVTNSNSVTLNNQINANGISGENNQNQNDDEGHTTSAGNVDVTTQIMNYLNYNLTGNNWVFLIVNVFGTWMGKIVGFSDMADTVAPSNGSFAALSIGDSGDSTTGLSTSTGDTNTAINNENTAMINNNINVDAISGQNNVNNNDGTTHLTTGWVEIDANLLNVVNMNVAGRSWMIVFLNIFGNFAGNLFFGQESVDKYALANAPIGGVDVNTGNNQGNRNEDGNSNGSQNNNTNRANEGNITNSLVLGSKVTSKYNKLQQTNSFEKSSEDELGGTEEYSAIINFSNNVDMTFWQKILSWVYKFTDSMISFVNPVIAYFSNKQLLSYIK